MFLLAQISDLLYLFFLMFLSETIFRASKEILYGVISTFFILKIILLYFYINQMIISKNPQFTGISARQQLEFTTHLLLTD